MVRVRHERFNAGLIASTYFNAHRSGDAEPLEVWDFVPGFERDAEDLEQDKLRRSMRAGVFTAFTRMPYVSVEQARLEAKAMVARMTDAGTEDAEAIVREVFQEVIQQPWEGV